MDPNTCDLDTLFAKLRAESGVKDHAGVTGEFMAEIIRADGSVEHRYMQNIVTRRGLNRLANRAIAGTASLAFALSIGTLTADASLDSTGFGEVTRKAAATVVQSQDWFALTMTWAGNADGLTGVVLMSPAIVDHASSGQGIAWNIANSLNVTLAASDFLNLTARIRVGSHNLGHSS